MSIEKFLSEQQKNKPRTFKDVAGRLLAKEEQVDTRPFKWEDEIGSKEWEGMDKELEEERINGETKGNWRRFLSTASFIHLIDPHHPLHIDEKTWGKIDTWLEQEWGNSVWECIESASLIHTIDPHHPLHFVEKALDAIKKELEWARENENWSHFVHIASFIHTIAPHHPLRSNKKERDGMDTLLGGQKEIGNYLDFSKLLSRLRLIDTSHPLSIDENVWDGMRDALVSSRTKGYWYDFAYALSKMRILAAHKIEITEDGIAITDTPPAVLDVALPPRPVRKK